MPRSTSRPRALFVCALMITVVIVAIDRIHDFQLSRTPPRGIVLSTSRRIVANWPPTEIRTSYRIVNRGGGELVLREASTSCGCTVASIRPKVLGHGQQAVIEVRATPPSAGTKTVNIHIETNAKEPAGLDMHLIMVGSAPPPFIVSQNGPISFGTVQEHSRPRLLSIETREFKAEPPWLSAAVCSMPEIAVAGGLKKELDLGNGVSLRRYDFEARLERLPPPGDFSGEVTLRSRAPENHVLMSIPMHGSIPEPVYSNPARLYTSYIAGKERTPHIIFTLTAADADFRLEAEPASENLARMSIRAIRREGNRETFEVVPPEIETKSLSTTLVFATNHPKAPTVRVPLTIRRINN